MLLIGCIHVEAVSNASCTAKTLHLLQLPEPTGTKILSASRVPNSRLIVFRVQAQKVRDLGMVFSQNGPHSIDIAQA